MTVCSHINGEGVLGQAQRGNNKSELNSALRESTSIMEKEAAVRNQAGLCIAEAFISQYVNVKQKWSDFSLIYLQMEA